MFASSGPVWWRWAQDLASLVCHQRPERCLPGPFGPSAFCGRCTGIYAGVALAVVALTVLGAWRRVGVPGRLPLALAALALGLNAADGVAAALGHELTSNLTRMMLGLTFGVAAVACLAPMVVGLYLTGVAPRRPVSSVGRTLAAWGVGVALALWASRAPAGVVVATALAGLGCLTCVGAVSLVLSAAYRAVRPQVVTRRVQWSLILAGTTAHLACAACLKLLFRAL
jgi:uncharacterized membrane protein